MNKKQWYLSNKKPTKNPKNNTPKEYRTKVLLFFPNNQNKTNINKNARGAKTTVTTGEKKQKKENNEKTILISSKNQKKNVNKQKKTPTIKNSCVEYKTQRQTHKTTTSISHILQNNVCGQDQTQDRQDPSPSLGVMTKIPNVFLKKLWTNEIAPPGVTTAVSMRWLDHVYSFILRQVS